MSCFTLPTSSKRETPSEAVFALLFGGKTFDPNRLIGKYIPNLTGKTFQITREYF